MQVQALEVAGDTKNKHIASHGLQQHKISLDKEQDAK